VILVFDTETTGKVDFRSPPEADHQPRLVQLGAILFSDAAEQLQTISLVIKPSGFIIPPEASSIHGITQAMAESCGVSIGGALSLFSRLASVADTMVCFNVDFDVTIMDGESTRSVRPSPFTINHTWSDPMKMSTDLCKIPGPYGFKWPKLGEAYRFFFSREMEGGREIVGIKPSPDEGGEGNGC
jgi:DNA polymerase III epsilon subunit-like protein